MRNILPLIAFTLLVASCGGKKMDVDEMISEGDLEKIHAEKLRISTEQKDLQAKLEKLNAYIAERDTVKKLPLVTVFKAKDTLFYHYLELQGNVKTKQNVVVYPEMSGTLNRVYVKEGQKVFKGQLLASIDDGGLGQQVAQLESQAALAKTTFERQKRLWEQNIGSEIQYLQAKTNYESASKVVAQAKSQLGKSTIRAPFAGVIDEVITDQGTVVSPGQSQVFRIVNLDNMYIETDVPESYITSVSKNKDVLVEFPVLGKSVNAKVRQAGNFINPSNRTFKIEVAVPNKDKTIKPNLTAKLRINDYTSENALLIPQSIISENASGQQYIYVVKDINGNDEATAVRTIIETGKTQGDVIEVLTGLENGAVIIEEGARSVKDGQLVKILNQ